MVLAEEKAHMMAWITRLYGDRLTQEELEGVEERLESVLKALESLRRVPLENWDEPSHLFKPLGEG